MKSFFRYPQQIFACLSVSLIGTATTIKPLVALIWPGKTFEGRSLAVQLSLETALFLLLFIILSLLAWWMNQYKKSERIVKVSNYVERSFNSITDSRYPTWIAWIGILVVFLVLLAIHLRIVFFPYQMEYREGAIVLTTEAFLNGINPWKLENNPVYINVYGFVYNFLVYPFAIIFGNKIWIYRLLSFASILGQIAIIARVMRRKNISWIWVCFAGLFIWLGQIYYTTPLARPDALGQLFFLLTIFIPWLNKFSTRSLIVSALCGIIGFYTKPYFVLGIALVAMYVFLFVSKKSALVYALGILPVLILTVMVVNKVFEAYFLNVIFSHWADTNSIFSYMVQQSVKFARDYWAFLVIALVSILYIVFADPQEWIEPRVEIFQLGHPFIQPGLDFNLFCILICAGLIYFSLGRHNGTIQAYYYQLLTPFLVILVFGVIQKHKTIHGIALLLIAVNLCTHAFENLKPDFVSYDVTAWETVSRYLDKNSNPLNDPCTTFLQIDKGIPVLNSGQTEYFLPYPKENSFFYPNVKKIEQVGNEFFDGWEEKLLTQEFDLFITQNLYNYRKTDIPQKYETIDKITFQMPHVFQTWQVDIMVPVEAGQNE